MTFIKLYHPNNSIIENLSPQVSSCLKDVTILETLFQTHLTLSGFLLHSRGTVFGQWLLVGSECGSVAPWMLILCWILGLSNGIVLA